MLNVLNKQRVLKVVYSIVDAHVDVRMYCVRERENLCVCVRVYVKCITCRLF